jgi:hypothetical protein
VKRTQLSKILLTLNKQLILMKKKITLYLLFLLSVANGYAQQDKINISIIGGGEWTAIRGADVDSISAGGSVNGLLNIRLGISIDQRFTDRFGLKHDLIYSPSTIELQLKLDADEIFKSKLKRRYIQFVPASPTWYYRGLQVYAGPYISVLMDASIQRRDEQGTVFTDHTIYGNATAEGEYLHKWDAGIVAGGNILIKSKFTLGMRYQRGLVPLMEDSRKTSQWKLYNEGLTLNMGMYLFR